MSITQRLQHADSERRAAQFQVKEDLNFTIPRSVSVSFGRASLGYPTNSLTDLTLIHRSSSESETRPGFATKMIYASKIAESNEPLRPACEYGAAVEGGVDVVVNDSLPFLHDEQKHQAPTSDVLTVNEVSRTVSGRPPLSRVSPRMFPRSISRPCEIALNVRIEIDTCASTSVLSTLIGHHMCQERRLRYCDTSGDLMYKKSSRYTSDDFVLDRCHGDDRKPMARRTGVRIFMAIKLMESMANKIQVRRVYDFDVESLAYVALWVASRYDVGSVREFPPYSTWTALDTEAICDSRLRQLYFPKHISPSNLQFQSVLRNFFRRVHDRVDAVERAERKGRVAYESLESPDEILREIKASIDQPLEELGVLTDVQNSHAHIQDGSLSERYKSLAGWVEWVDRTK